MTNKNKKSLVFFGNESLASGVDSDPVILRALVEAGYDVLALVVHERASRSRKQKTVASIEYATSVGIPVLNPEKLSDCIDELRELKADAGILAAYGKIIPKSLIDMFPAGIINLHPSLLPEYRGSTPIEQAILDGKTQTGISIMALAPEMDAGPVFSQQTLEIKPDMTKAEIVSQLHVLGASELIKILDRILDKELLPSEQDHTKATYCGQINTEASVLDFSKPANQLVLEIIAYAGWPKSRTTIAGLDCVIGSVCVAQKEALPGKIYIEDNNLYIGTAKDSLQILKLQPSGKNLMDVRAFLAGYRNRL